MRQHSMYARQSFLALCHCRDLRVATLFPGILGGLGRDRGLLYHDKDFSALFHDRNLVSRQGLGLGQAWVATRVSLCCDRVFPRVAHSCHDTKFYVATRFSKSGVATGCFSVTTHRAGMRAQQSRPRTQRCATGSRLCPRQT